MNDLTLAIIVSFIVHGIFLSISYEKIEPVRGQDVVLEISLPSKAKDYSDESGKAETYLPDDSCPWDTEELQSA